MPENALVEQVDNPGDDELVVMFDCPRCGRNAEQSKRSPHLCVDCEKAENSRYTHIRVHQDNWMEIAKESGIDLWLQQPRETQWEYSIWCAYRDSYPGKKPSYADVAKQLNTTYNAVKKIAQRWSFPARMQAWMAYTQQVTLLQRRQEILDMNADHINMSRKLRDKLNKAIDLVDPYALKPSEIVQLGKMAADLERTAMTDSIAQEEMRRELLSETENPELKKVATKKDDMNEVLSILLKAGALGDAAQVGVKQTVTTTTTTEVVGKKDDGETVVDVTLEQS